jgi:hypothetical protein
MAMYEHRRAPLLPRHQFLRRLARNFLWATGLVAGSLALGTAGYHLFGRLGWLDAFLNASMILTGMGPVDRIEPAVGKLFAAFYALFSGIMFLTSASVLIAPIFHRFIHRFHLEEEAPGPEAPRGAAPPGPPRPAKR